MLFLLNIFCRGMMLPVSLSFIYCGTYAGTYPIEWHLN
jgi:hypothetical protein